MFYNYQTQKAVFGRPLNYPKRSSFGLYTDYIPAGFDVFSKIGDRSDVEHAVTGYHKNVLFDFGTSFAAGHSQVCPAVRFGVILLERHHDARANRIWFYGLGCPK